MEGKLKGFFHTFLLVMASIAFYQVIVKPYTPTTISSWIGI